VRVAAALAIVALTALVAGCGGKSKPESIQPPITTAPEGEDRGKVVVDALVRAAGARDAEALWELLSTPSRQRLGPFERFRGTAAAKLSEDLGGLSRGPYRQMVSERVTDNFGIVALANASGTYAAALRLEGGSWRVELGGPVHIEPLGIVNASTAEPVVQVAAEIRTSATPPDLETAVAWLDGLSLDQAQLHGTAKSATLFANLVSPVRSGRHTVVAFAGGAKDASAVAWTFSVRGAAG
jgi:hypothetical protein